MTTDIEIQGFLAKAQESLAAAESEFANQRYNTCANRCYYACFQAAVAALLRAGVRSSRPDGRFLHDYVQAHFALFINRRKEYPEDLRNVLGHLLPLRHRADYQPGQVNEMQVARALRTARHFVQTVHARGGEPE